MKKITLMVTILMYATVLLAQQTVVNFGSGQTTRRVGANLSGEVEHVNYGPAKSCDDIHKDYDDFLAYQQLFNIMGGHVDQISVSYDDTKGTARIDFPEYMSNCMDLEFHVIKYNKDEEGQVQEGDYFLAARNKFFDGKQKYQTGDYKDLTAQQKYDKCLAEEGVLPEGSSDYNMSKVKTASPSGLEIALSLKEKGFTNLYFASSQRKLAASVGFEVVNKPAVAGYSNTCFEAEKLHKEELIVFENSRQRDTYQRYAAAKDCESCEYDALAQVFAELYSDTGNATVLDGLIREKFQSPLEVKLMQMLDERVEQIKDELADLKGKITRSKDREEAGPHVEKYMTLLKELDEKVLSRQIAYLEDRYDCEANSGITNSEREACTAEIRKLKSSIKDLGKGYYFGTSVLNKLKTFGFASDAVEIKKFVLRSKHYGKYNGKDPNKPLKDIEKELSSFVEECDEAEREYLARNEGDVYSDIYETQVRRDIDRLEDLNETYARFIQETQQACQRTNYGYVNQVKCQRNMEKASDVELLYREETNRITAKINKYGGIYDKYKGLELAYEKDQDSDDDDDDDDDGDSRVSRVIESLLSDDSAQYVSRGNGSSQNMFATSSYNNQASYSQQPYFSGYSAGGGMGYNGMGMNSMGYNGMGMNSMGMNGGLNFNLGMNGGMNTMMMPWQQNNFQYQVGPTNYSTTPTTVAPSSTGTYSSPTGF